MRWLHILDRGRDEYPLATSSKFMWRVWQNIGGVVEAPFYDLREELLRSLEEGH